MDNLRQTEGIFIGQKKLENSKLIQDAESGEMERSYEDRRDCDL